MSAATAAIDSKHKEAGVGFAPVKSGQTVWDGTMVFTYSGDGSAYPARAGTPTDLFLGVSYGAIFPVPAGVTPIQGGTPGTANVKLFKRGSFVFGGSGFAATSVGVKVYALDDNNVTVTSTNNVFVGYIVEYISSTSVRVRIDLAAQ